MEKMTIKQEKFCEFFLQCGNATESAKKAGYSESTAAAIGYENLQKPYIKEYIEKRRKEMQEKAVAKTDEILRFWSDIMRAQEIPVQIRLKASEFLGKAYDITVSDKPNEKDKLAELVAAIKGVADGYSEQNKIIEDSSGKTNEEKKGSEHTEHVSVFY